MKNFLTIIICVIIITACTPIPNKDGGNGAHIDATPVPKTEVTLTPIDPKGELTELIGTSWILTDIDGNPPLAETFISLQIRPKSFSGSAGCNRYGAKYSAMSPNSFLVNELAIDAADCHEPEGVLDQENHYTKLLLSAKTYQFVDQELHLLDEQGTIILRFQPRQEFDVSPEALVDKTWQLTSATDLDTEYLSEFTLSFGESTFSGTTVCRDYEGRYQAEDDSLQITFMSMTTEYNCNDKDGHTEAQYTTLLSNVEQYNITSNQLELFTRHGEKLIFELVSKSQ
jgi:heat shock protein HslJ